MCALPGFSAELYAARAGLLNDSSGSQEVAAKNSRIALTHVDD